MPFHHNMNVLLVLKRLPQLLQCGLGQLVVRQMGWIERTTKHTHTMHDGQAMLSSATRFYRYGRNGAQIQSLRTRKSLVRRASGEPASKLR